MTPLREFPHVSKPLRASERSGESGVQDPRENHNDEAPSDFDALMEHHRATERENKRLRAIVRRMEVAARKGGIARAAKLSPRRRRQIARRAAEARWGR